MPEIIPNKIKETKIPKSNKKNTKNFPKKTKKDSNKKDKKKSPRILWVRRKKKAA